MERRLLKWFKNVSIKRKLYFVMGIMALLIFLELCTLWFAVKTLSSVRAYVGGEGLWSKGQKDAVYYLQKYGRTRAETDYIRFKEFLKVPLGDAKARRQLGEKHPDLQAVRQGFLEGQNHPEDIDGMIWLFRNFSDINYIKKAIKIWGEAEPLMTRLIPIGEGLNKLISSGSASEEEINQVLAEIDPINQQLTALENDFSFTLGEGSRWLESLILKLLFIIALTVEFTGLILTISVSINMSKGINEVVKVANEVANGEFKNYAKIYSEDEIGRLARSFNNMVKDLHQKIIEKEKVEEDIKKQKSMLQEYTLRLEESNSNLEHFTTVLKKQKELLQENTNKLEQSNKDLEQFAYVASHDLREPLRTIASYVQLVDQRYKDKLDSEGVEFIDFVVDGVKRMDTLITDLLSYSRLSTQGNSFEQVNCEEVMKTVIAASAENIKNNNAQITVNKMPVIYANKQLIIQLFQNLLNNAIKFHRDVPPEIIISARERDKEWLFSVSDNGIGIEKKYEDRIFIIFQRLHSRQKYEGTGIGLTICKKIAEQHGGMIWFESELNKGSVFYVTIKKQGRK